MVFCLIFHAFILLLQGKLILKLSRSECMNWIKNKYCSYCLRFSLLSSYFCFCSFLCIFSLIIFFVDFILECTSLVKTSGPPFFGVFLLATTFEKIWLRWHFSEVFLLIYKCKLTLIWNINKWALQNGSFRAMKYSWEKMWVTNDPQSTSGKVYIFKSCHLWPTKYEQEHLAFETMCH